MTGLIQRRYSHPTYIRLSKNILATLAFVYPPYMIWNSFTSSTPIHTLAEAISTIILSLFMTTPILVSAYFWQDIWIEEEGLAIEFLWYRIRVKWEEIIEVKPAWGFLGQKEKRPLIVLVKRLTHFHLAFGILYGLSINPGFIIFPSINEFQNIKESIQNHTAK